MQYRISKEEILETKEVNNICSLNYTVGSKPTIPEKLMKETVIRDISCGRKYKSVKVEGFNK